jgi:hypothetical protein
LRVVIAASTATPVSAIRTSTGDRADDDECCEHERTRDADHRQGAARPPEPVFAVERTREQRQAGNVAQSRRRERVDQRADAVAGTRVEPADAAADEPDRGAPGAGRPDERAEEAHTGEPEPDRLRARQPAERSPYLRAEQLRHERDDEQRERQGGSGREYAV